VKKPSKEFTIDPVILDGLNQYLNSKEDHNEYLNVARTTAPSMKSGSSTKSKSKKKRKKKLKREDSSTAASSPFHIKLMY
jgi:hypothetical protein